VNDPTAAMSAPDELPRLDESFPRQFDAHARESLIRLMIFSTFSVGPDSSSRFSQKPQRDGRASSESILRVS
jgi:hypothetical protein